MLLRVLTEPECAVVIDAILKHWKHLHRMGIIRRLRHIVKGGTTMGGDCWKERRDDKNCQVRMCHWRAAVPHCCRMGEAKSIRRVMYWTSKFLMLARCTGLHNSFFPRWSGQSRVFGSQSYTDSQIRSFGRSIWLAAQQEGGTSLPTNNQSNRDRDTRVYLYIYTRKKGSWPGC